MTDHYLAAEDSLRKAEERLDELEAEGLVDDGTHMHYRLSIANAHTLLAQVQTQGTGFASVSRMADAVSKEAEGK